MKVLIKVCTALFLLTISANLWAIDVDKYISGGWGDPNQSGHGYSIEVMDDNIAIIFWYTHNPDGTSTFLVTVGYINGNKISGNTSYYSGMKFGDFDPRTLNEDPWGTVTVTFHDCNTATLNYSSTMSHKGVPFGSGTIQLKKLVSLDGMHCSDSPLAGSYHITSVGPEGISFGLGTVFENGDMAYFAIGQSDAEVGIAFLNQTSSKTYSFNATAYSIFGGSTGFSGNGTIGEDGLGGNMGPGTALVGTRFQSFYHNLTMQELAGPYAATDMVFQEYAGNINIALTGQVSGTTTTGCNVNGSVFIPNETFNQFYIDFNLSNCATPVRIIGAGVYDFEQKMIIAVGEDGTYGYIWELR